MQRIGFSTGLLYQAFPASPLSERVTTLSNLPLPMNSPAMPIEVHIAYPEQLLGDAYENLRSSLFYAANRLFYHRISIHAPTQINYPSKAAQEVLPKLHELADISNASAVVFHPDIVSDPAGIYTSFPEIAAVENLDITKSTGRTDMELSPFKDEGFKFVLDLNHAQSHGEQAPGLVETLINFMGNRLTHSHISGLVNERNPHCLYTHNGTAAQAYLITQLPANIPLIHEGVVAHKDRLALVEVLSQEMQLLNRFAF
ncbi:MAG TPA: hypothetical protein PKU95_03970 [Candidatus Dojkabacteria bacterium]|nr:hypothetical protein [Candidatus Dojkabacteria bacterium]